MKSRRSRLNGRGERARSARTDREMEIDRWCLKAGGTRAVVSRPRAAWTRKEGTRAFATTLVWW